MMKRTRTGCISCRIRRIKCDETRPACQRCQAGRRRCDGYLPEGQNMTRRQMVDALAKAGTLGPASEVLAGVTPSPSLSLVARPESAAAVPNGGTLVSPRDLAYFDFFRRETAPNTDELVPSAFWGQDLLQLAHGEPALWHATLALGALHRRWQLDLDVDPSGTEKQDLVRTATTHYGRALSLARHLDSPAKLLALSLPLIASANMLGFWDESHLHILAAYRILAHDTGRIPDAARIASTLTRMDIQSLTFNDERSPYPYHEAAAVRAADQGMVRSTVPIEAYTQASSTVFALFREVILNGEALREGIIDAQTYSANHAALFARVLVFEAQMAAFERRETQARALHASAALTIRVYHCWLRLFFRSETASGPESRFDARLGYFERIATLAHAVMRRQRASSKARSVRLSLEPALVAPLFDMGKRCRHPVLRRHAIALLRGMNRHEGMWRSDGAAAALEAIVRIEEERHAGCPPGMLEATPNHCDSPAKQEAALSVPWEAWAEDGYEPPVHYSWLGIEPVPEEERVTLVMVFARFEERQIDLQLVKGPTDPGQPYATPIPVTISF